MASPYAKPDLLDLGKALLEKGPDKTLKTPKRIRILFNGVYVADTTSALYVWEKPYYPYYYVPQSSFKPGLLEVTGEKGPYNTAKLTVGGRLTDRILVFGTEHLPQAGKALAGMVRVEFSSADAWFEEDERVYVHPRDPFKRVDIVYSSRPVEVYVEGVKVASATGGARHLYETGLPVRYYLPVTAVDPVVLRESGTRTECPYKGIASYYDVAVRKGGEEIVVKDVVWYYRTPTHESAAVAGCLCFYNEKVDIVLDGEMLERPNTVLS